mmetsp:Transcript_149177/g.415782  ORF Transcript_149177/g.415782 Transcript_149177/m.415782 type:complete len:366 (+) Transcript_149177:98-1195(+)
MPPLLPSTRSAPPSALALPLLGRLPPSPVCILQLGLVVILLVDEPLLLLARLLLGRLVLLFRLQLRLGQRLRREGLLSAYVLGLGGRCVDHDLEVVGNLLPQFLLLLLLCLLVTSVFLLCLLLLALGCRLWLLGRRLLLLGGLLVGLILVLVVLVLAVPALPLAAVLLGGVLVHLALDGHLLHLAFLLLNHGRLDLFGPLGFMVLVILLVLQCRENVLGGGDVDLGLGAVVDVDVGGHAHGAFERGELPLVDAAGLGLGLDAAPRGSSVVLVILLVLVACELPKALYLHGGHHDLLLLPILLLRILGLGLLGLRLAGRGDDIEVRALDLLLVLLCEEVAERRRVRHRRPGAGAAAVPPKRRGPWP